MTTPRQARGKRQITRAQLKLVASACYSASLWEQSLADVWKIGSPERSKALRLEKRYLKLRTIVLGARSGEISYTLPRRKGAK